MGLTKLGVGDKSLFPSGQSTSNNVALASAATPQRLILAGAGTDKNAGSVPSAGGNWQPISGNNSASVSIATAMRIADGSANDQAPWTWTTPQCSYAWIAELDDFDGLTSLSQVSVKVFPAPTNETVVKSVVLTAQTAMSAGLAVAFVAVDTLSNWDADSWTNSFASVLRAGDDPGVMVRQLETLAGQSAGTTASTTDTGDQSSGILLVISGPVAVGRASEVSTALAVTPAKALAVGQTSSVQTALAVAPAKAAAAGIATATEQARPITPAKVRAVGIASEACLAQPMISATPQVVAVGIAEEASSAMALVAVGGVPSARSRWRERVDAGELALGLPITYAPVAGTPGGSTSAAPGLDLAAEFAAGGGQLVTADPRLAAWLDDSPAVERE